MSFRYEGSWVNPSDLSRVHCRRFHSNVDEGATGANWCTSCAIEPLAIETGYGRNAYEGYQAKICSV
jgi:hypothetical protein